MQGVRGIKILRCGAKRLLTAFAGKEPNDSENLVPAQAVTGRFAPQPSNLLPRLSLLPRLHSSALCSFALTALLGLTGLLSHPAQAQQPAPPPHGVRDLGSDTWVATDALGRQTPTAATARPARKDRFVGIFYFVWHSRSDTPFDNTKILAANPDNPAYGGVSAFHWWGEPAVGYFRSDDPWVARKNLQMLADAGVDVLFLDMTNAATYPANVKTVFDTAAQMRREGLQTPKIGFITHASTARTVTNLYQTYYAPGLYRDLWFKWDGKPLILGDKAAVDKDGMTLTPEVRDFFTWRKSWAWDSGQDKWQWMDKYPQKYGWHTNPKVPEEIPVVIAGHPTDNLGRSYHSAETWGVGTEPPVDKNRLAADRAKGLQFSQQWRRALEVDPQFVFVTGWNEWTAQRFVSGPGGGPGFLGRVLKPGETFFVDNYNEEFSRDAMPMKGGYGDNYYMQLVDGIRQFKGVRPIPVAHGFHTPGSFAAWANVTPEYRAAVGSTSHRDWPGWGGKHYTNATGRNDIITAKVACDAKNITFYVKTSAPLTARTDPNWMQLLIDADRNAKTGWHGYDYVVNSKVLSAHTTTLKRLSDGKTWQVSYSASGREMAVTIPRARLGLTNLQKTTFDFHWADNVPVGSGDIADWWYNGDSAPDGRFNYRYTNTP